MALMVSLIAIVLGIPAVTIILAHGAVALSHQRRMRAVFRGASSVNDTARVPRVPKADLAV